MKKVKEIKSIKSPKKEDRILRGTFWSLTGIFGRQITVFIIGIILARLLSPAQFGMIAMITVLTSFGSAFLRFGFGSAIIQNTTIRQEDLSTVFIFNVLMGIFFGSLIYLGSHQIAKFYNEPKLINIARALSVIFVFNSLTITPRAVLFKQIKLKIESIIIIISAIVSGIIAIWLAYKGYGVWALALKVIIQSFLECILLNIFCGWKPSLIFNIASLKKLLPFASKMFGSSFLYTMTADIDKLIIGKLFNTDQLGFYERSKSFNYLVKDNLSSALAKVMFPVFSDIQNDMVKFIDIYKLAIRNVAFFSIPLFLGLSLLSKPLIILLLTEKWVQSAVLLQILAISGIPFLPSVIMGTAIAAKGRADIILKIDAIKAVLSIISVFVGSKWGIEGVAYAITSCSILGFFLDFYVAEKLLKVGVIDNLKGLFMPVAYSLIMILVLFVLSRASRMSSAEEILILPITGITIYAVLNYIFNKKQFLEFKRAALGVIKK